MKKIFIGLILFLVGCSNTPYEYPTAPSSFKVLGSPTSNQTWLYLCGLLTDFIPKYMDELKVLDTIGKQLNIKFLAMIPKNRCPQLNNRLCWPLDNEEELLQSYQEIIHSVHNQPIQGYIGFSNGGFFLNKLAQFVEINEPIISIGAASPIFNKHGPENTIYLLIGKEDKWHYQPAITLYNQSKDSNLTIHLIEYDGGHEIPESILRELLKKFMLSK